MSDIDIGYNLDASGYLAGINAVTAANQQAQASMGATTGMAHGLSRALTMVTPGRATLGAMAMFAQQAAQAQQGLSGLAATSTVTGAKVEVLAKGIRGMARDMPLGGVASRQLVEQFTRMGVAGDATEKRIVRLSTSVAKLSGATGEAPGALATGMTELARATGNTNLDPKRFEALGDSLTTVSAKSGASASNILHFSKSIAPMANAAGIGATGVLGISSAFARLGEDGIGASTAVNKMLSDMNRAVRDGSPEMRTYAQFAGKSADEFERLFKANPAEALTQVTEAIAKAGPAGPRMLEQIGIEGIRGQRSIQALVASGGLRPGIEEATNAYGSGSTAKAAEAAFGGLSDQMTQLGEATSQVVEAFGAPLLGPLTTFAKVLTSMTGGLGKLAASGPGQTALTAATYGGLGLMVAKPIASGLMTLMMGRQMATSGIVAAAAGGYASQRGLPATSLLSRIGAKAVEREAMVGADGRTALRTGFTGGTRGKVMDFFGGVGRGRTETVGAYVPPTSGGPGLIRRGWDTTRAYGSVATTAGLSMIRQSAVNATVPWEARSAAFGMPPRLQGVGAATMLAARGGDPTGRVDLTRLPAALKTLDTGVRESARGFGAHTQVLRTATGALGRTVQFAATTPVMDARALRDARRTPTPGHVATADAAAAARPAATAGAAFTKAERMPTAPAGGIPVASTRPVVRSLPIALGAAAAQPQPAAGRVGGSIPGLGLGGMALTMGIGAVISGIAAGFGNLNQAKQTTADRQQADISGTINAYRESIGKATDATKTFGSVGEQMSKNISTAAKFGSFSEAKTITDADWAASQNTIGKKVRDYAGSATDIAAQIQAASPTGVTPEELTAIKIDLGRQMDRTKAAEVLKALSGSFEATGTNALGLDQMAPLVRQVAASAGKSENAASGWGQFKNDLFDWGPSNSNQMDDLSASTSQGSFMRAISGTAGGGQHASTLTDAAKAQVSAITEGIAQQFVDSTEKFGSDYAQQERGKSTNAALKEAYDSGNADLFLQLSQAAGADMGGKDLKDKIWSPADFEKSGFDFTAMVAKESEAYQSARNQALGNKGVFTGTGGITPTLIEQSYTKDVRERSPFLGDVFDARSKSPAATAMSASLAIPGSAARQSDAMNAVVAAADKAGLSMVDLAVQSAKTAQVVGESGDAYARMKAVQARAESEMSQRAVMTGMTGSEQQAQRVGYLSQIAGITPTNDAELQTQQDAKAALTTEMTAAQDRMKARLMVQLQYQIASGRATEDFNRSQEYAKKDYELQVFRMERNFATQRERAVHDFNLSQARAEEDFGISRARTIRDFNRSALRAEHDYQLSRSRSLRDFNRSLARQIEDAAKSMYDPYSRIQTKATWDTANLLANLAEQTAAMAKQKTQLDALRKMGLSAQSIDQLGLGKSENAQQLNNIMADASPANIAALNAAAKARAQATGALYTDSSNVDLKRSREDFTTAMKDQETDFKTSVARSRADLNTSLNDSAADFSRATSRSRADFATGLARSRKDLNISLADMAKDRDTAMSRAEKALDVQLGRMAADIALADKTISGDMETLAAEVNKAIHGKAVNWQKILKNDTGTWVTKMQTDVIPKVKAAFAAMGISVNDVTTAYTSQSATSSHGTGSGASGAATGGPIPGYSPHPKADNVLIRATAGEFMQPVDSVGYYGPAFMQKVRFKQFPRELAMQGLATGGMVYNQMEAWLHKNLPGVAITSSYRPGAITALGNTSMHSKGKALDLAPSMATFNKILSAFGPKIYQLFYSPADGRTMLRGKPWRMDSVTKGDHWNHVHWAMESMTGLAGALGLDPAALKEMFAKAPRKDGLQRALTEKAYAALSAKLAALGAGDSMGPYTGGEDVARWSPEVNAVLKMLGRPLTDSGAVLRRIQSESGGNPNAVNNWDSNARRGTPSKGLMQVIDPTFRAYRSRSLPNRIFDPKANVYAGSNYAVHRYGSLNAIDPLVKPGGYDDGGWMDPGFGTHVNGTTKPEAVLTDTQWSDVHALAESVGNLVTADQLRGVNAAAGAHIVVTNHNNQSYAYDQRNDFSGAQVQVVSGDPDDMARKLEAKAVQGRLTATRGVRRNR